VSKIVDIEKNIVLKRFVEAKSSLSLELAKTEDLESGIQFIGMLIARLFRRFRITNSESAEFYFVIVNLKKKI